MEFYKYNLNRIILSFLAIIGISFWFIIGYPFGNHNESYEWLIIFNSVSIKNVLFNRVVAVSYRPLGQLFAYILYIIDNNQIHFVQLFNYIVCVGSYLYVLNYIQHKFIFSVLCLLSGAIFFPGYIYLFHIHGIFYSPLLLNIGLLYYIFECYNVSFNKIFLFTIIVTLLFSMFHPFALLMSIAFLYGYCIENIKNIDRKYIIILFLIGIISFLFAILIWGGYTGSHTGIGINNFMGLINSYKTTEINNITSFLSIILCIMVIISVENIYFRLILFILTLLAMAYFYFNKIPFLIIWIVLVLFNLAYNKKWSLNFLLLATIVFPFVGTGSPTYSIFSIFVSIIATSILLGKYEECLLLKMQNYKANIWLVMFCIIAITSLILIKSGVRIPIIYNLSKPLLSEKEKTNQLENIIRWYVKSEYSNNYIYFKNDASNPTEDIDSSINYRRYRPPTYQYYLNKYLDQKRGYIIKKEKNEDALMITFGGQYISEMKNVYFVKSENAGDAIVYKFE